MKKGYWIMSTQAKKTPDQIRKENLLIVTLVSVILLALAITLVVVVVNGKKGNQLEGYLASDAPTNFVRMNISYTDKTGKERTGDIVIHLRPDMAPETVKNFQNRLIYVGRTVAVPRFADSVLLDDDLVFSKVREYFRNIGN